MVGGSSPSSTLLRHDADTAKVLSAIGTFDNGGASIIAKVINAQVATSIEEPISEINLKNTFIQLFKSSLGVQQITQVIQTSASQLPESSTERHAHLQTLCAALLDSVEIIKQIWEDTDDMDVNEAHRFPWEDKALQVVQTLMKAGVIPQVLVNTLLSPTHLIQLGLHPVPRNPAALQRGLIKQSTAIYFKQRTSNLLRESSEGFSRLIILLTGPDVLHSDPRSETHDALLARAMNVWSQVTLIIAHFSLSPPRVLDLLLEIASCHLANHWRFFIALLKVSRWAPPNALGVYDKDENTSASDEDMIKDALSVDPSHEDHRAIVEVLAFRFGFYQRPDTSDTPHGLLLLAALLIKHHFVDFALLLPKLSPDESGMAAIHDRYVAQARSRSGPANALTMTVLVDEDAPENGTGKSGEESEPTKPPPEQRIQLLHALLATGEQKCALFLLAKYPWTVYSHPQIASIILRNISIQLEPVYRLTQQSAGYTPFEYEPAEVVSTLQTPVPPPGLKKSFEFFYTSWADALEPWQTPEDILTKGQRWLSLLAGLGGRDSDIMSKICRIIASHFESLQSEKRTALGISAGSLSAEDARRTQPTMAEMKPWLDIIRNTILPALTISDATTASFSEEIWRVLAFLPHEVRCYLYGEWKDSTNNVKARTSLPPAASATVKTNKSIKQDLSRITAAQSNPTGASVLASQAAERGPARALAKNGDANPIALWEIINNQVTAYGAEGNIGEFVIEVGRYINALSKDVAVFMWIDMLSRETSGSRVATLKGRAVEHLATFIGLVNRRYTFDLKPLLQFVANRTVHLDSSILVVLEKLMSGMTGEAIVENYAISDDQLLAFASGPEMVREAFYETEILLKAPENRPRRSAELIREVKKSGPRLLTALRETHLAVPILVGLAMLARSAVELDFDAPVRAKGQAADSARDVFTQYCDLLAVNFSAEELLESIPDLATLLNEYDIDPQLAWKILRPKLKAASNMSGPEPTNGGMDVDEVETELSKTMEQAKSILTKDVDEVLGSAFYVRFHSLEASDLVNSAASYDKAAANLSRLIKTVPRLSKPGVDGRLPLDARHEDTRLKNRQLQLSKERQAQSEHVERVIAELRVESAKWFSHATDLEGIIAHQLGDWCLHPRAIQSPGDALFVAKFIRLLHDMNTPGIQTGLVYNTLFSRDLNGKIHECTESEARNLGRCLALMMVDLAPWHKNEATYYREAHGTEVPASETDLIPPKLKGMFYRPRKDQPKVPMTWSNYRNLYAKFHNNLCSALVDNWATGNRRNATVVALQVLKQFPVMDTNRDEIKQAVKSLLDEPGAITPDLRPQFTSYLSQLTTRKDPPFVPAREFHTWPVKPLPKTAAAPPPGEAQAAPAATTAPATETEQGENKTAQTAASAAPISVDAPPAQPDAAAVPAAAVSPPVAPVETKQSAPQAPAPQTSGLASLPPRPGSANNDARVLRARLEEQRNNRAAAAPAQNAVGREPPKGPAPTLSDDEARAAARARKFAVMSDRQDTSGNSTPRPQPPVPAVPSRPPSAAPGARTPAAPGSRTPAPPGSRTPAAAPGSRTPAAPGSRTPAAPGSRTPVAPGARTPRGATDETRTAETGRDRDRAGRRDDGDRREERRDDRHRDDATRHNQKDERREEQREWRKDDRRDDRRDDRDRRGGERRDDRDRRRDGEDRDDRSRNGGNRHDRRDEATRDDRRRHDDSRDDRRRDDRRDARDERQRDAPRDHRDSQRDQRDSRDFARDDRRRDDRRDGRDARDSRDDRAKDDRAKDDRVKDDRSKDDRSKDDRSKDDRPRDSRRDDRSSRNGDRREERGRDARGDDRRSERGGDRSDRSDRGGDRRRDGRDHRPSDSQASQADAPRAAQGSGAQPPRVSEPSAGKELLPARNDKELLPARNDKELLPARNESERTAGRKRRDHPDDKTDAPASTPDPKASTPTSERQTEDRSGDERSVRRRLNPTPNENANRSDGRGGRKANSPKPATVSLAARMGLTTTSSSSSPRDDNRSGRDDRQSSREGSPDGNPRGRRSGRSGRRSGGGGGNRLLQGAMRAASGRE